MALRRRASATTEPITGSDAENPPTDPPIRPPKFLTTLKTSLVFSIPYFYLIFSHYGIDYELKKSILISAFVSVLGFLITLKMIPVASKYVSRRNLFGYDINKKGTPDGSIKVPESLGIVVGIVFLVVAILFQYFNFTADSNLAGIVPCPRHRLPRFDPKSGLLTGTNDGTLVNLFLRVWSEIREVPLYSPLSFPGDMLRILFFTAVVTYRVVQMMDGVGEIFLFTVILLKIPVRSSATRSLCYGVTGLMWQNHKPQFRKIVQQLQLCFVVVIVTH